MKYWTREVAGWLLIGVGLYVFYQSYRQFDAHYIVEGGGLAMVGIFIFRGGIHLLKVAVAAQVCLEKSDSRTQSRRPVSAPAGVGPADWATFSRLGRQTTPGRNPA
jgi:hypothetical protein